MGSDIQDWLRREMVEAGRMFTPRNIAVLFVALGVVLGGSFFAEDAVAPEQPKVMGSMAFDWAQIPVHKTPIGESRKFFQAPTATLDELECHVTTLNPGEQAHPPHQHPDEELLIIKEGTVEALVAGEWKRVGPGSVIFQASNQLHAIRNVGDTPATYHVIKWNSPGMLKKKVPAAVP
jgi:quercetin dioxygenase-like cupin family protein